MVGKDAPQFWETIMKKHLAACIIFAGLNLFQPAAAMAEPLSDADMVALQVAMQTHIDSALVDGAVLSLDPATGNVVSYYPTKAHPKIMTMGKHIIMCSDFVDVSGKPTMANFYMASDKGRYVVFNTTFGVDPALEKMMKDGKVAMAN